LLHVPGTPYARLADLSRILTTHATPHWGFLTLDEVAGILRSGKRTAYELARIGRLRGATTTGGSWRVLGDEFDRWVRRGGVGAEGEQLCLS